MDYAEYPAPAPLSRVIRCFWFMRGSNRGGPPQAVVADGRVEIVLHLADPFLRYVTNGRATRQACALLAGQMTAPMHLQPAGEVDVVGIRFRTAAASALLRVPLGELTDRVEPLADCDGSLASALMIAASRATGDAARVAALSTVLAGAWRTPPDPLVVATVAAFESARPISVESVARSLSVSARTLERRIDQGIGLGPAALRRVIRFRRAFRLLEAAPSGRWGRVAAATGYYDQAHLIREFRRFSGVAPQQFFGDAAELARSLMGGEPLP